VDAGGTDRAGGRRCAVVASVYPQCGKGFCTVNGEYDYAPGSTIMNALLCLAGGILFSVGLGAISNRILNKSSLV